MLCDIIENAKLEKQELIKQGKLESALDIAKKMLLENLPIDLIARITDLPKEQIEELKVETDPFIP